MNTSTATSAASDITALLTESVRARMIEIEIDSAAKLNAVIKSLVLTVARFLHTKTGMLSTEASECAVRLVISVARDMGHDVRTV